VLKTFSIGDQIIEFSNFMTTVSSFRDHDLLFLKFITILLHNDLNMETGIDPKEMASIKQLKTDMKLTPK
jgi:hypothetical protein